MTPKKTVGGDMKESLNVVYSIYLYIQLGVHSKHRIKEWFFFLFVAQLQYNMSSQYSLQISQRLLIAILFIWITIFAKICTYSCYFIPIKEAEMFKLYSWFHHWSVSFTNDLVHLNSWFQYPFTILIKRATIPYQ